jgi:hypothetical protein
MRDPLTAVLLYAAPHHLTLLPSTTISNSAPQTVHAQPSLGILAPKPPPPLAQLNARPRDHRTLIHGTPPPPSIALHHHFQRRAPNRARTAQFRDLGPKTTTPARAIERATTVPSLPSTTVSTGAPQTKHAQPV